MADGFSDELAAQHLRQTFWHPQVPRGRRLHSGDRAHLPAAAGRLPVPAAGTDPHQGHGRDGHLLSGRKEPMISRAPAISGTTPSPGYRASSTVGKIAEQGPHTAQNACSVWAWSPAPDGSFRTAHHGCAMAVLPLVGRERELGTLEIG